MTKDHPTQSLKVVRRQNQVTHSCIADSGQGGTASRRGDRTQYFMGDPQGPLLFLIFFRVCDDLSKEEKRETNLFLEECDLDPSLRERLSILSRTFENQRKLVQADSMLFLNHIFTIEPLVST